MREVLTQFEDQLKRMSKDEKDLMLAKVLQQKKQVAEKAKEMVAKKRQAGIKPLVIELHADQVKKFKALLEQTELKKTDLFIEMMNWYEAKLEKAAEANGSK
jgi:hypothetical protein